MSLIQILCYRQNTIFEYTLPQVFRLMLSINMYLNPYGDLNMYGYIIEKSMD